VVVRDVILRDGTVARLRSPGPADEAAIRAFYDGLDEDDRWMRFHGPGRTDVAARAAAQADGDARVALVAHREGEVAALAEYVRLREPGVAEVAFAVHRALRGLGLATRMLEQLAAIGAERGIHRFEAEVVAHNRPMLRVFTHTGFAVTRHSSFGEVHLELDIRPSDELAERRAERDHVATVASLRALLAPRSVAVAGAGPDNVGGELLAGILRAGFRGVASAVNPGGRIVGSQRPAARVADLPEPPELLVVAVPAAEVLDAVDEAAAAGVRAVLVLSTGFGETDEPEGRERQDALLARVREHGLRMVGPNSLGLVTTDPEVALRALVGRPAVQPGGIALSSQSGALGVALLGHVAARRLGISSFVSLGERADVSTNDLLEWWEDDERTRVVLMYVESFGNPRRFSEIAQRVARRKPIVCMKGARPAVALGASRTAQALGAEAPVDALLQQAGVLRVGTTQELFDVAALLERQPLTRGRSVGVVTTSGGLGTLAADAIAAGGLHLAPLAPATVAALDAALPAADRTTNPVDMGIGAGPAEHAAAVEALLADEGVDAVVALHADLSGGQAGAVLAALDRVAEGKPVLASVVDADGGMPARPDGWRVPNHRFPEAAIAALARSAERREWLARPLGQLAVPVGLDLEAAAEAARGVAAGCQDGWLDDAGVRALLATHGIPLLPAVAGTDGPVALKAVVEPPGSSSDVDAVLLGLEGEAALAAGEAELRRRIEAAGLPWRGATAQPLAEAGADVLVGAVTDPRLGPVVALGLGGRQAGPGTGAGFRLAPLRDADAEALLDASPAVAAWLDGERGGPPLARAALVDLLARLSALVTALPRLAECDLNPVRVTPYEAVVLDARVRLAQPPARTAPRAW
jgi:acetate---CoA ligase (ADP-forming)